MRLFTQSMYSARSSPLQRVRLFGKPFGLAQGSSDFLPVWAPGTLGIPATPGACARTHALAGGAGPSTGAGTLTSVPGSKYHTRLPNELILFWYRYDPAKMPARIGSGTLISISFINNSTSADVWAGVEVENSSETPPLEMLRDFGRKTTQKATADVLKQSFIISLINYL